MTNPADHFYLTPDASRVVSKRTGTSWSSREVARILFSKEGPNMNQNRHPLLLARDQEPDMPAQANGASCIDSASCLVFVQKLLEGLDDMERGKFIEGLSNLVTGGDSELEILHRPNGNGMPRGATDSRLRRRPALDSNIQSLNSTSFNRRWGKLTSSVSTNGAGRR